MLCLIDNLNILLPENFHALIIQRILTYIKVPFFVLDLTKLLYYLLNLLYFQLKLLEHFLLHFHEFISSNYQCFRMTGSLLYHKLVKNHHLYYRFILVILICDALNLLYSKFLKILHHHS